MTEGVASAAANEATQHGDDGRQHPRTDLRGAVLWIALGVAVLVGSITMDRLESQNINPYTVPGLLPGLLGLAMILLGSALAVRSVERGALKLAKPPADALAREERKRVAVVTSLCVGYGVVLIGHGLPFWLASSIYVFASILVMQRMASEPAERRITLRLVLKALAIAVAASVITQAVFQDLFLVRLP
ncbi:MAG TPA: tripartite tricarboxylate transporter TctB family protein [Ramlibacter sp.]|uniref:tripartite tricarboxylate transporter TctB family protein n=1 Tax=Ramlibacter sp. TaxID=1917967 RepID=UPI002CCAE95C|nr:tripartite tricarboxylate transporter TctB family protein [Ramlibacter sp.]HVZ45147.1 tripartite tricarboxylate transporter TctB family protein [Ramlibacter sp.]